MNTIKRGVFTGAAAFGFLKAMNTNRKVNRALRRKRKGKTLTEEQEQLVAENTSTVTLPDGKTVIQRAEPTIALRTSTKAGIAGIAGLLPIIQGIQEIEFPWPWVESFTNSDLFVQIATIGGMWLVARLSRSPAQPGAL